jgi:hypothetical protein
VNQGDGGIDIIATYKKNLILIQCKSVEKPIPVQMIRNFESSVLRFPSSLGIIVCDSTKIKDEKYLTFKANSWLKSSKLDLKVCDERLVIDTIINHFGEEHEEELVLSNVWLEFFNFLNFKGENVTIDKIVTRFKPY